MTWSINIFITAAFFASTCAFAKVNYLNSTLKLCVINFDFDEGVTCDASFSIRAMRLWMMCARCQNNAFNTSHPTPHTPHLTPHTSQLLLLSYRHRFVLSLLALAVVAYWIARQAAVILMMVVVVVVVINI